LGRSGGSLQSGSNPESLISSPDLPELAEICEWHPEPSEYGVSANERLTALSGGLLLLLLAGSLIGGFALAAASLTYAIPFIFFRDG
jgi:hypothetical protein